MTLSGTKSFTTGRTKRRHPKQALRYLSVEPNNTMNPDMDHEDCTQSIVTKPNPQQTLCYPKICRGYQAKSKTYSGSRRSLNRTMWNMSTVSEVTPSNVQNSFKITNRQTRQHICQNLPKMDPGNSLQVSTETAQSDSLPPPFPHHYNVQSPN